MSINLGAELKLTPEQAAAEASADGQKLHVSTILRWILRGVDGVKLEAVRLGGRWVTSREALQRFAERLTPRLDGDPVHTPRTPTARRRASERAERELGIFGI